MGSRVQLYLFYEQIKNIFTLTDKRMTRFMMTLDNAVRLVWKSIEDMKGGEMYVVKALNESNRYNS